MITHFISFGIGLIAGAAVALFTVALCRIAAQDDRHEHGERTEFNDTW